MTKDWLFNRICGIIDKYGKINSFSADDYKVVWFDGIKEFEESRCYAFPDCDGYEIYGAIDGFSYNYKKDTIYVAGDDEIVGTWKYFLGSLNSEKLKALVNMLRYKVNVNNKIIN